MDEGKTWLDWTAICLGLCEEKINNGFVKIEWPPGSSEFVSIPIICNSDCIRAEIREKSTSLIYVPETFVPKDLPESLQPLRVEDQEHIFSVSEIESYIQCPQRYYHIYKIGRFDQNITSSAIGENAVTKGLIIHEILQGMDPAVVLRSYGISDPKKEELYKGMKKIFMSSEMMSDITEDHKELPFLIEINNIQFAGKIDRLIKKADGSWNIIDYKTTEVPIGEVEKHCDENYSLQLTVYRNGMEQLLDRKVRSFIYFTSLGKFIEVKGDEDRILENIKKSVEKMRAKQFLFETCADCRRKHEFELE